MQVIREAVRVLSQSITYSLRSRRPLLAIFVAAGAAAVAIAAIGAAAAPVLIYPVL